MKLISIIAAVAMLVTSVFAGELVQNGDFSQGVKFWELGQHNNAVCGGSVVDGAYKVAIKDGCVQEWSVQLCQKEIPFVKGKTYKVSVDAWSTGKRVFKFNVGMNGAPYTNYTGNKSFEIGKKKKTISYEFVMSEDNKQARIEMNLGDEGELPVFIDNVSITEK